MLIDFRIRPPYKSFKVMNFFRDPPCIARYAHHCGMPIPPSAVAGSIDLFMKEMEEAGVDAALVVGRKAVPFWGSVSNQDIADMLKEYPGKFWGYGGVELTTRETILRDVDEAILELGLSGVSIEPGFSPNPIHADEKAIYPVYERCQDLGVPVMVNTSYLTGPDITWGDAIYLDHVANDFPGLTIIASHGGWPYVAQMVAVCRKHPNVYLTADIYEFNLPGSLDYVHAANGFMQDQFLWASSYPLMPLPEAVRAHKALPFTEVALRKNMYDNAARLLKLPMP